MQWCTRVSSYYLDQLLNFQDFSRSLVETLGSLKLAVVGIFLPWRSANMQISPFSFLRGIVLITCDKYLKDLALYTSQNKNYIKLHIFNVLLSS